MAVVGPARKLGNALRAACRKAQLRGLPALRDRYVVWGRRTWKVVAVNMASGKVQLLPVDDPAHPVKVTTSDFAAKGYRTVERPEGFRVGKVLSAAERAWTIAVGEFDQDDKLKLLGEILAQAKDDAERAVIQGYLDAVKRGETPIKA